MSDISLNIPAIATAEPSFQASVVSLAQDAEQDCMAVGSPVPTTIDPKSISIYPVSINPITYSSDPAGIAAFDIVFSVGIICDDISKTYQVVKRIGVDKCKMAAEVDGIVPMSIVEATKEEIKPEAKQTLSEAKRFRILAGLE